MGARKIMPELNIQDSYNKCVSVRKASIVYGDTFLIDVSPSDELFLGAWDLVLSIQRQPSGRRPIYFFCNTPAANPERFVAYKSDWPVKKNPFTQVGLLDIEEEQSQELIMRLRATPSIPYRENLANRLVTLFHDAKEEDPSSAGITVGSLRYFYCFLQSNINLKCPTISLTPECNIYATWRVKNNLLLSIHFLPDGDARFIIFKPNNKHPERTDRISGTTTIDVLMETVALHGVRDWVSE